MRARSPSDDRLSSCALILGGGLGGVLISVVALPLAFSGPFPTPKEGGEWVIDSPAFSAGPAATPAEAQTEPAGLVMAALTDTSDPPLTFAERWNLRVPQAAMNASAPDEMDEESATTPGAEKPDVGQLDVGKPDVGERDVTPRTPAAPEAAPEHKARAATPPVKAATSAPKRAFTPVDPVEQYLWEVYLRKPVKSDSTGDFTWKDQAAAKRLGLTLRAYVIGGMDPDFREQLYHAGRAMDASGLRWSMLSAFRDDYRQGLAAGFKAHGGNSLHGGSRATGGYGHGRAVDITTADGESETVWHWVDAHGAKYGLSRPMPRIDPAHIQARTSYHDLAQDLREARQKLEAKLSGVTAAGSGRTKVAAHVEK
jgi:hypothetical protein